MNTQTSLAESRQGQNGVRANPTKEFNDFMNKLKPQITEEDSATKEVTTPTY